MIKQGSHGKLLVDFPGLDSAIEIDPPADTEQAIYVASSDGTWLTLMEKAWTRSQFLRSFRWMTREER